MIKRKVAKNVWILLLHHCAYIVLLCCDTVASIKMGNRNYCGRLDSSHLCHRCVNWAWACFLLEAEQVNILCTLYFNNENAIKGKIGSKLILKIQAKKMKMDKNSPPNLGATVWFSIPGLDKRQGESCNRLALVMSVMEDSVYQLGTAQGSLNQLYGRSQFTLCPKRLLRI